jgi:hypothetical protein
MASPALAQSAQSRRPAASGGNRLAEKQISLIDFELLSRAEQRVEAVQTQLFNLEMKVMDLQAQIEDLDYEMTPERIQRALAFVGSVRPMDELREGLRSRLESEKVRLNKQLELLESRRSRLETALAAAEAQVERLRQRMDSE